MNMEPEQFEAGENVTDEVRRNRPGGMVVSVRLTQEDSVKLIDLAEESGKTISQLARQAIRAFIAYSGRRPAFLPEITGSGLNLQITALTLLGPRTITQSQIIDEEVRTGRDKLVVFRTGNLSVVA